MAAFPPLALFCMFAWEVSGARRHATDAASRLEGPDPSSQGAPAIQVYRTPDPKVRVEGYNVWPGDSLSAGQGKTRNLEASLVYAVESRPTGVELMASEFFLPHDERIMEIWHQGKLVHSCEMPAPTLCKYDFDYSKDVGKRFTVKALKKHDRSVVQVERIYTPYPYMCAASTFSRPETKFMDCDKITSFPKPLIADFDKTSKRGFAIELEFMARDSAMTKAEGLGTRPLRRVKRCASQKVQGTEFEKLARIWNWEEEPSMVPFQPGDDGVDESEYVGLMAELTSPGPPNVLFGQEGIADVARVFHTVDEMGAQVGLWAQLHVHINVRSQKANPAADCCLGSEDLINIWAAWAKYQMVIDEMQNPTNVNNKWAHPLYMEDKTAQGVFSNMHANRGGQVPIEDACEVFFGPGNCDSKNHDEGWKPPDAEGVDFGHYYHGPARYYAVNFAPLPVKGTVEIRQQAGTLNPERAQRWIQFVLAFAETFKSGEGLEELFDDTLEKDIEDLKEAQSMASFDTLFAAIGDRLDDATKDYYMQRRWNDAKCAF